MQVLDALLLGAVEGITEFLPISSTGHLILAARVLHIPETEFVKTFQIAIQFGAMLSVVFLYWRKFFCNRAIIQRIIVGLLPALGVGFVFYAAIRKLLESDMVVVVTLFLGGVVLLLIERFHQEPAGALEDLEKLSYRKAFLIGLCQAVAVIPGVSRAGATIVGGLLCGLKRTAVVEFSFLLGVPTIAAATALDLFKHAPTFSSSDLHLFLWGFVTAFLVAWVTVKFFLRFISSHSFASFGVYRMVTALLFLWLIL